jgi:hypothetical protein
LLLGLAACGGDQAPSNIGTSSTTLRVTATVTASPTLGIENSKTSDQFETEMVVDVFKVVPPAAPVPFPGATVKVKIGNTEHVLDPVINRSERYRLVVPGGFTDQMVTLNVDAGADFVHGVARKAPGIQVFTKPLPGESVSIAGLGAQPFTVTWNRPAAADIAQLHVSQFDQQVADSGSADVPAANLQQGDARECRLTRTNTVQVNSVAGSQLDVRVRQSLSVNIVP